MRYRDLPSTEVSARLTATPEAVWAVVTDITFPCRFSPELQDVEWVDGDADSPPAVGRRFRGRNVNDGMGEWTTESTVVEVEPLRRFVWDVIVNDETSCRWAFEVDPTSDGVILRQWGRMGPGFNGITMTIDAMPDKEPRIIAGRLEQWREAMSANLAGARSLLEG